jgi:hypothetical protein
LATGEKTILAAGVPQTDFNHFSSGAYNKLRLLVVPLYCGYQLKPKDGSNQSLLRVSWNSEQRRKKLCLLNNLKKSGNVQFVNRPLLLGLLRMDCSVSVIGVTNLLFTTKMNSWKSKMRE